MSEITFIIIIIAFFICIYCFAAYRCKKELNSLDVGDSIYRYEYICDVNEEYTRRTIETVTKVDKKRNVIYTDTGEMYTLYDFYRLNITKVK